LKVSICVPVYSMSDGLCEKFLVEFLSHLMYQQYKNFEVIVSDQSTYKNDYAFEKICTAFSYIYDIKYVTAYTATCAAENVNTALKYASGDIIKLMYVDDFFVDTTALSIIVDGFIKNPNNKWSICGFTHCNQDKTQFWDTRVPWYGNRYVNGDNTTGNPSTYAIRKGYELEMDTNLKFIVDGEYFYRSFYHYGDPIIISDTLVAFREHECSAFRDPALIALRESEMKYCEEKYKNL